MPNQTKTFERFFILCVLLFLFGCDTNKEERRSLGLRLNDKFGSLSQVEKNIRDIDIAQNSIRAEISDLKNSQNKDDAAVKENKDSLTSYVMSHKMAVSAALASGAGIGGILASNLNDQDRSVTIGAGIVGAAYCLFSDDDCTDAITKVTYFGSQIVYFQNSSTSKQTSLYGLQSKLVELENTKTPYLANRTLLLNEIEALKSNIISLECRGPFCL